MTDGRERSAALLTRAQRDYLRGEKADEYAESTKRDIESRIRDRVRASMYDIKLLTDSDVLDVDDILTAFEPRDGDRPPLWAAPALLYLATPEDVTTFADVIALPGDDERPDPRVSALERAVSDGVERAILEREEIPADVSTEISVTRVEDPEALADEDLTEIHPRRLKQLLAVDAIDATEYGEAIKQRIERAEGDADDE